MGDRHSSEVRSYTMSRIRKTNTKPEILVRKFLFSKGLRYRLYAKQLKGNPDIVFPRQRVAIFINGCFWHAHEGCKLNRMPKTRQDYWVPKILRTVARDKENLKELTKQGWKVLTIWECELHKNKMEKTLAKLYKTLQRILNK